MLHRHSLLHLLTWITFVQACPMHGIPDRTRAERSISDANIRKRDWIRPNPQKFAISNVYVFDGYELSNETRTVVIDGAFIGTDATNATVIDGNGGTLLPGFFDSHNHPTALEDLQNLTRYGVTTNMCASCWAVSDLCESFRHQPGLPDFYSSGYSAIVPNSSHSKLAETLPSLNASSFFIYNASMASSWVRDRVSTGSDYIKLVAEAYPPTLTQEEHDAINEASHQAGLWTWTHAATISGYNTSILSKTDFIQHTPADGNLTDGMIAAILANRQYVTPTVNIYLQSAAAQAALQLTGEQTESLKYTIAHNVKKMYDAGIPILVGTDASINANGPATIYFGLSLHQEMKLLNQYGVSNIDVLRGATSRAAQAYNLLDRGVIAPGKRADLVLIQGNPIMNISAIDNVVKVWTAGAEFQ